MERRCTRLKKNRKFYRYLEVWHVDLCLRLVLESLIAESTVDFCFRPGAVIVLFGVVSVVNKRVTGKIIQTGRKLTVTANSG